ncbi:hypothetical protein GWK47_047720 [Chionoecetes opilio]|uniref:Uncharacterized protein n=1 Tax=Chionoecetes opilio TaxID=41210 RepID=A0A8J4YAW3_CHIOP|nr:hypothetical protein GWK47_047720 [Chionoecetes opilio]
MQLAPLQPLHTGEKWPSCARCTRSSSMAPRTSLHSGSRGRHLTHTPPGTPTRGTNNSLFPFARTETFSRSFLPRYSRLWNRIVRQIDIHQATTLHIFKCAVNAWLMPSGHN